MLARGAEALGIDWAPTPLATISAPRGQSPPCVYRGFCVFGCSTNAKQSALITWIPRAIAAGAEIRDLAMVGRIETDAKTGRVTGVHYHREGRWRFQRASNVVVAGYAIETPRLLLNSADRRHPDGLANSSGLVGQQSDGAVEPGGLRHDGGGNPLVQGAAVAGDHRALELRRHGQGFLRRLLLYEPGAAADRMGRHRQPSARGLWGQGLRDEMEKYNHQVGLKIVGEVLPDERNRVTLADETTNTACQIARVTFSYGENDKRLIRHALGRCATASTPPAPRDIWDENDDTCHLNGTARMGDDPRTSVVNADCRSWDIPNLWICDGSVFPTVGGVNPSLTIQAIACRTADRIQALAARGEARRVFGEFCVRVPANFADAYRRPLANNRIFDLRFRKKRRCEETIRR